MATYEGLIANHDCSPFYGTISIDDNSGLIKQVSTETNVNLKTDNHHKFSPGVVIYPGFIDLHVHAREDKTGLQNYKEDYSSIAKSALAGGLTVLGVMPNTPSPLSDEKELAWHRNRIDALGPKIHLFNYIAVTPDSKPLAGDNLYKLYVGPTVGPLFFKSATAIKQTLKNYRGANISFHIEDYQVLTANKNQPTHQLRRPPQAVTAALDYILPLVEEYHLKAIFCHWSIGGDSLKKIAKVRQKTPDNNYPKLEVTPTHLLFDAKMLAENPASAPFLQLNPALQSAKDRLELVAALKSGMIDFIASDHAPHLVAEKLAAFVKHKDDYPGLDIEQIFWHLKHDNFELWQKTASADGTSGVPWSDTFYLAIAALKERHGFSHQDIAKVAAYNPACHIDNVLRAQYPNKNFGKGLGKIAPGYYGSLTAINYQKSTLVKRQNILSKSGWSPLEGMNIKAALECVVIGDFVFYP